VKASGNEKLLTQTHLSHRRALPFSQPKMTKAFDDLVAWVKPAPSRRATMSTAI